MLPKSNQNQIYIWIDAPRSWDLEKIENVRNDINTYLTKNIKEIKNITSTSGQAYI
jgi:multidrug efflux pump subunit AcrB